MGADAVMQSALLLFESDAFQVEPGEDDQTNPRIFGRALAQWVGDRLRERNLPVEDVIPEDFGWCVPVRLSPHAVHVACASGENDGHWQLFVFAEGGVLQRLLGRDSRAGAVERVFEAVKEALNGSPDIRNLAEEPATP